MQNDSTDQKHKILSGIHHSKNRRLYKNYTMEYLNVLGENRGTLFFIILIRFVFFNAKSVFSIFVSMANHFDQTIM